MRSGHVGMDCVDKLVTTPGDETTMTRRQTKRLVAVTAALVVTCLGNGQDQPKFGYKDTPMLPGEKWHVHDGDRPQPKVINPGTASTQEQAGRPPSDAIVLFDGKDLSHWRTHGDRPAAWKIEDGASSPNRRRRSRF